MKNPERYGQIMDQHNSAENAEEIKYDPTLASLWRKHHFLGNPPATGTESEKRLKTTCAEYARLAISGDNNAFVPAINLDKKRRGGGEDYFSEVRANKAIDDFRKTGDIGQFKDKFRMADDRRRELHNIIVMMTLGKDRSAVDTVKAEEITDFACEIEFGVPCEKALDKIEKGKIVV